ncbi:alpha/beta hydrolase family protein [Streptomyces sp. NBC_01498]|uniref:alpha/beta hydrolase n=1 Tax=Streptomyces sp. NBC_01498 TaxID=2975870 RepID=UPI002E7BABB4|nr:alpha/beta hydrolase [Streptomyces sp. NBC_01498]WTL28578.1 alpha/beta hydrolase family protein [Streptomyces sp. NBC_01498]
MAPRPRSSSRSRISGSPGSRPRPGRARRTLLAVLVTASVAVPVSGAARPAAVPAPAPVPAQLAPLTAADPAVLGAALEARYAANLVGIRAAERMAAARGDRRRAASLRTMADAGRRFLSFDGRDGGRTAEVFGDLAAAGRIAVLVPGSDTGLDRYERFRAGAVALRRELGEEAAVIAWLGYRTPGTVSPEALTPGRAHDAAPELRAFLRELSVAKPEARTTLLCHSYGSAVCAPAARGAAGAAAIVLYGSPGTGVDTVGDLHTTATVWAGRGARDWIADVPHVRLQLPFATVGFGPDPVSEEFGAHVFDAGTGGHSDYLKPGSVSLRNLALIVSGGSPAPAGPSDRTVSEDGRHA